MRARHVPDCRSAAPRCGTGTRSKTRPAGHRQKLLELLDAGELQHGARGEADELTPVLCASVRNRLAPGSAADRAVEARARHGAAAPSGRPTASRSPTRRPRARRRPRPASSNIDRSGPTSLGRRASPCRLGRRRSRASRPVAAAGPRRRRAHRRRRSVLAARPGHRRGTGRAARHRRAAAFRISSRTGATRAGDGRGVEALHGERSVVPHLEANPDAAASPLARLERLPSTVVVRRSWIGSAAATRRGRSVASAARTRRLVTNPCQTIPAERPSGYRRRCPAPPRRRRAAQAPRTSSRRCPRARAADGRGSSVARRSRRRRRSRPAFAETREPPGSTSGAAGTSAVSGNRASSGDRRRAKQDGSRVRPRRALGLASARRPR